MANYEDLLAAESKKKSEVKPTPLIVKEEQPVDKSTTQSIDQSTNQSTSRQ